MSKSKDDTERLIARHFGKPPQAKANPSPPSVDRARDVESESSRAQRDQSALAGSSRQQPESDGGVAQGMDNQHLEPLIASIASNVETMRIAVVQLVEQMGRLVSSQMEQTSLHKEGLAAQRQQIEAVARLAPLLVRSAEGVSGSVREAIAGIQTLAQAPGDTKATTTLGGNLSMSVEQATDQGRAPTRIDAMVVSKRPRGRPRKNPLPAIDATDAAPVSSPPNVKRPRGRPRKHPASTGSTDLPVPPMTLSHPATAIASSGSASLEAIVPKRPRGRPRKLQNPSDAALLLSPASAEPAPAVRRPRGRPRKHPRPDPSAQGVMPDTGTGRKNTGGAGEAHVSWEKKAWSRHASVTSQPDRSSLTKFTTVIQMKRKDWDLSGFQPDDGLAIERRRNEVLITRAGSGGVRATKIGATRVEVRAKTLGNLNFNKVKLLADEDTIVLKGSRI